MNLALSKSSYKYHREKQTSMVKNTLKIINATMKINKRKKEEDDGSDNVYTMTTGLVLSFCGLFWVSGLRP